MNRLFLVVLLLSCFLFAQTDVTPPNITSFSLLTTSVDITSGPATAEFNLVASDVGGDLDYAEICLISPSGRDTVISTVDFPHTEGPETVTGSITILGHLEPGDWRVGLIQVFDVAGNWGGFESDDLLHVINTGEEDVTPPVLEGFSISPTSVDITTSSATINISLEASDDLAGLDYASFRFLSPSGSHGVYEIVFFTPGSVSETVPIVLTIPTDVEWGIWTLNSVYVRDVVENNYTYLTSELASMSTVSTTFEVINNSIIDVTAPLLTDFYYSPTIVDISTASGSVDIHIVAEDDLSELNDVYLMLLSPNYIDSIWTEADFIPAGTHMGDVTVNMIIPMYVETGNWRIQMSISDGVGNRHYYNEVSIAAIPLPATLTIVSASGITHTDDIPQSYTLYQNYPNPFNPTTTINYELPEESHVFLSIFDITGRNVQMLVDQTQAPGYYSINWNGNQFSSGIYFYQIQVTDPAKSGAGNFQAVRKCLLIK